jgi:outer membrane immunogenic protein
MLSCPHAETDLTGWAMKRLFLASCALGAITPAFAADLPVRMPVKAPVAAPILAFNWTGCYLGAQAGGGWGRKNFTDEDTTPGFFNIIDPSFPTARTIGAVVGGQVGCDYQFASNVVVGIEGAGSWADIKGSSDPFFGGKAVFNADTKWLAAATGRVGYAFDRILIYAKGGAAWAGDKYGLSGTFIGEPFSFAGSETRFGYTIGAGIEWAFLQNWSARVEYAYYDFGTKSLNLFDATGTPDPSRISQRIQTVMVGINYHFWTGPPVSAKY